jgi:hypothetical protein
LSLFDLELIAERPDKCQRSAAIWQCLVSSILVICAQAADSDQAVRRRGLGGDVHTHPRRQATRK